MPRQLEFAGSSEECTLLLERLPDHPGSHGSRLDRIHVVVGDMLIAPGFEPLLRIACGLLRDRHSVTAGLRANANGSYARVSTAVITPLGFDSQQHEPGPLAAGVRPVQ